MRFELRDGRTVHGRCDGESGWYTVRNWWPRLGEKVIVHGLEREVVMVVEAPRGTAIMIFPDAG